MKIRPATVNDAEQAIDVLRRSISELCVIDHENDSQEIAGWLANKNIESWSQWVSDTASDLYVADDSGKILGIGMISHTGEILLNYVNPDVRYLGISKALLCHMEVSASTMGITICSLESTGTARRFYLSQGYKRLSNYLETDAVMIKKLT